MSFLQLPGSPGLLILVHWTNTHQLIGKAPVLPIPGLPGHPPNSITAYHQLLEASPTTSLNQSPVLTPPISHHHPLTTLILPIVLPCSFSGHHVLLHTRESRVRFLDLIQPRHLHLHMLPPVGLWLQSSPRRHVCTPTMARV